MKKFAITAVVLCGLGVGYLAIPQPVLAAGVGKIVALINQLHGAPLDGTTPADGEVMVFTASDGTWGPGAAANVPHAIISADHSDSSDDSVTRGDIIIGDSTPEWNTLVLGSAGQALTSVGGDAAWGNAFGANGVTTTFTGTANVTITDGVIDANRINVPTLVVSFASQFNDNVGIALGTASDSPLDWSTAQATAQNLVWGIRAAGDTTGGGTLILTELANANKDHHLAVSNTPAYVTFSQTDVDSDATQYLRMFHNVTQPIFHSPTGAFRFSTDGTAADGTLQLAETQVTDATNGAFVSWKSASESFTSISTATLTTSSLVPAGATLKYVVGLVDTTISGGGVTGADWGDGVTVDRYNNDAATAQLTAGDTIDSTDYTLVAEAWSTGTQDVTITFVGGTPTAGALTVTVFYTLPTAGS